MSDELNRAAPAVAQLDADNLPPDQGEWVGDKAYWSAPELPEGAHCFGGGLPGGAQRKYYPVEQVQKIVAPYVERIRLLTEEVKTASQDGRAYQRKVDEKIIAQRDERIRLLEREQLPKLADDDEVTFPNDTGLAVIRTERYYQLREAEERIALLERELAERQPASVGELEREIDYIMTAVCSYSDTREESTLTRIRRMISEKMATQTAPSEAFAWAALAENGNVIIWSRRRDEVEPVAAKYGRPVTPLIAYIDGRTAGTASEAAPLVDPETLSKPHVCGFGGHYWGVCPACIACIAVAPSTQENAK